MSIDHATLLTQQLTSSNYRVSDVAVCVQMQTCRDSLYSAATRCCEELGAQTRYQAYFRLYRSDRPKGKEGTYPEALLDTWLEFEGMHEVVQDMNAKQHTHNSNGSTIGNARL